MKIIETIKTSTAQKNASLKVRSSVKAGGLSGVQHNRKMLA